MLNYHNLPEIADDLDWIDIITLDFFNFGRVMKGRNSPDNSSMLFITLPAFISSIMVLAKSK